MQRVQFAVPPLTPLVKGLMILSVVLFLVQLSAEAFFSFPFSAIFGFSPHKAAAGWIWQPFTYAFLHAGIFHILFNLLVIWTVGSELEGLWGSKTFFGFFWICTLGAALTHGIFAILGFGSSAPVIGSSGFVYGLLLAYGILFGDRLMYFFMLFPMPAKYFVMLLGGVELVSSVFYQKDGIAHFAHLGGMLFGFLYLMLMARWRQMGRAFVAGREMAHRKKRVKGAQHLRLIKGEDDDEDGSPKQWH